MSENNKWNYTQNNRSGINALEKQYYLSQNSKDIYNALKSDLAPMSFGKYLKRYIHDLAPDYFTGNPEDYSLDEYRAIIVQNFEEKQVPISFSESGTPLKQSVKNWLEASSVDRDVVFLLGFALQMEFKDVQRMLLKGLQQQGLNGKSPREAICYWCYKNKYSFNKYRSLWEEFEKIDPNSTEERKLSYSMETERFWDALTKVRTDDELIAYLSYLKNSENKPIYSVTMKLNYDRLFAESQKLVAQLMNRSKDDPGHKSYEPSEITEADIENIVSAAIPRTDSGNLVKANIADIPKQVGDRRFTRQRAKKILNGKAEINRFDLITLSFLNHALKVDEDIDSRGSFETLIKKTYADYIKDTNAILVDCSLSKLYPGNLYECLTLMCMLTEYPLGSYSDVFEYAYHD